MATIRKDRISIIKSNIPYKFYISLPKAEYQLELQYNEWSELFTVGLYKSDRLICVEPVIYNRQLFRQLYQPGIYPALKIVPLDNNNDETAVTWENFNETVFLMIDNIGG